MQELRTAGWVAASGMLAACGVFVAGCTNGGGRCDAAALNDALDAASPGDTVALGACAVTGPVSIPAGVTLAGRGRGESTVVAPEDGIAVRLHAGEQGAAAEDLSVEASGCAGMVATGSAGAVRLARVDIEAPRGIAVAVESVPMLSMRDVSLTGPITPETADEPVPLPPYDCHSAEPATHGLLAVEVGRAELAEVRVRGFAAFGALFVRSVLNWNGGEAGDNVGTGLEVWGGEATLEGVALCGAQQGTAPTEAYNGVFAGEANVRTTNLRVCDGSNFGLMHDGATAAHEDLVARDNGFAGVWAQNGTTLEVTGAAELTDNGFAAVAGMDSREVRVEGATIRNTAERDTLVGETGRVRAGDGVHLVGGSGVLRDLHLTRNERVGLLADLAGGSTDELVIDDVVVEGAGDQLGAIAQNGSVSDAWDDGITREGAIEENDASFEGQLDIAGAVGPSCLPDPGALMDEGLEALGI